MFSGRTAGRHRLCLGASVLLAAGALALPAGALASVNVHPASTLEGNSGKQTAVTKVDLKCGDPVPVPNNAHCDYELRFTGDGTARGFEDFVWDPPRQVTLSGNQTQTVAMNIEVLGDTTVEGDETYTLAVEEQTFGGDGTRLEDANGSYTAGTIVNDDRKVAAIGKAPVTDAPAANVHVDDWDLGKQCQTDDATGKLGAFGAWGYYVPGCQVVVTCPQGTTCTAHTTSTITSDGDERVTLNARTAVRDAGKQIWRHDVPCDEQAAECTAEDQTPEFTGGQTVEVQCNGVHARAEHVANVACMVDVQYS